MTLTGEGKAQPVQVQSDRFRGEYRGKQVTISHVSQLTDRRVVIVLDSSGSMRGGPKLTKWNSALSITREIVAATPTGASLALVVYSEKDNDEVPFGPTDRGNILRRLDEWGRREPHSRPPLLHGIEVALKMLVPPRLGDAIYLVTDGDENVSKEGFDRVSRDLSTAGVRLFAIVLPSPDRHFVQRGFESFPSLAELTGGWTMGVDWEGSDQGNVVNDRVQKDLAAMLQPGIRMTVLFPSDIDKWREWKLSLVDINGKALKHFVALSSPLTTVFRCARLE